MVSFIYLFWCGPLLKSFLNLFNIASVLFFWPWGIWDVSSLRKDRTHLLCTRRWSLNNWTTRKVPNSIISRWKNWGLETGRDFPEVTWWLSSISSLFSSILLCPFQPVIFKHMMGAQLVSELYRLSNHHDYTGSSVKATWLHESRFLSSARRR